MDVRWRAPNGQSFAIHLTCCISVTVFMVFCCTLTNGLTEEPISFCIREIPLWLRWPTVSATEVAGEGEMEEAVDSPKTLNSLIWCVWEFQQLISPWVKSMAISHACKFAVAVRLLLI